MRKPNREHVESCSDNLVESTARAVAYLCTHCCNPFSCPSPCCLVWLLLVLLMLLMLLLMLLMLLMLLTLL